MATAIGVEFVFSLTAIEYSMGNIGIPAAKKTEHVETLPTHHPGPEGCRNFGPSPWYFNSQRLFVKLLFIATSAITIFAAWRRVVNFTLGKLVGTAGILGNL